MFDLAEPVLARLRAGHPVRIVRVVDSRGFSSREPVAAAALDETGVLAGTILAGAADSQLVAHAPQAADAESDSPMPPSLVSIEVGDPDAFGAGLSCGGEVRVLVQDARDFGERFWKDLADGRPQVAVTALPDEGTAAATAVGRPGRHDAELPEWLSAEVRGDAATLLQEGSSRTAVLAADEGTFLLTALWPTPTLFVVGPGLIAQALGALCELLGWTCEVFDVPAPEEIADARPGDAVLVLTHDLSVAGPSLAVALISNAGYVGALGSRRTQSKRRDWLRDNGVPPERVEAIHGPAGLDLGALSPAEIALAITAEILAVRTGSDARPLRERSEAIHRP